MHNVFLLISNVDILKNILLHNSSAVATLPDDITENLVSTGRFAYSLDTVQAVDSAGKPTFDLNNVVAWSTIHSTDPDDADAAYDVGKTLFFKICSQQDLTNIKFSVPGKFIYFILCYKVRDFVVTDSTELNV